MAAKIQTVTKNRLNIHIFIVNAHKLRHFTLFIDTFIQVLTYTKYKSWGRPNFGLKNQNGGQNTFCTKKLVNTYIYINKCIKHLICFLCQWWIGTVSCMSPRTTLNLFRKNQNGGQNYIFSLKMQ